MQPSECTDEGSGKFTSPLAEGEGAQREVCPNTLLMVKFHLDLNHYPDERSGRG